MKAYLYVLDTLADWEIGYLTAELHSGRFLTDGPVPLHRIGAATAPVSSLGGMTITPEASFAEIDFAAGDCLILPGADTWLDGSHGALLAALPELLDAGVVVAAICGATFALAAAGILDRRQHASNDGAYLKYVAPGYAGEANYREEAVVTDGALITASGFAPLEFAHAVFRRTGVMRPAVLEAWYRLYATREPRWYHALMAALAEPPA
jgi:putative intracellular protease/amidase